MFFWFFLLDSYNFYCVYFCWVVVVVVVAAAAAVVVVVVYVFTGKTRGQGI